MNSRIHIRRGLPQLGEPVHRSAITLFVLLLLTAAAIVLLARPASCQDELSCSFAGTVKLDGANVDDGTVITAIVDGDRYSTTTPTGYGPSTYAVKIQPWGETEYRDGTMVFFEIDRKPAHQVGSWEAGQNIRLDLTASSTPSTPSPTPGQSTHLWVVIALSICCILDMSMVGGLAYLALRNWDG